MCVIPKPVAPSYGITCLLSVEIDGLTIPDTHYLRGTLIGRHHS